MYLYNDSFIVTYLQNIPPKKIKCVSEQKILTAEDLRRNIFSKNVFHFHDYPIRASEWNSVVMGSNLTQANFL